MLKRIMVVCILMMLSAFVVNAQEETPSGLAGDYDYEGTEGENVYTGSQTLSGSYPVYEMTYEAETEAGDLIAETVPALSQGNYVVAPIEGVEGCTPAYLLRQSDGSLFGVWRDFSYDPPVLGFEFGIPQEETTGFAGTYDMVGSYASGAQYQATVEITENEGGWYDVVYNYTVDEVYPDSIPYSETGIGLARDNFLGNTFVPGEEGSCGVYVAEFAADGTYEADFVGAAGILSTEIGAKR